jgi:hypothetical protein
VIDICSRNLPACMLQEDLCIGSVWNVTFSILVAKCLQYRPVKKVNHESSMSLYGPLSYYIDLGSLYCYSTLSCFKFKLGI